MSDDRRSRVRVDDHEGVAVLTLDDGRVNALSVELLADLEASLDQVAAADAVVLTAAGHVFCAGADLRRLTAEEPEHTAEFLEAVERSFRRLLELPRPVVVAVNGHAIAGGCVLACCSDRRLMSSGTIGLAEVSVGLPFPAVAVEALAWAAPGAMVDLSLTGRLMAADEAARVGLIDIVVPLDDLLSAAVDEAATLGALPRTGYAHIKRQLQSAALHGARQARDAQAAVVEAWTSEPGRAAMRVQLERLDGSRR